MTYKLKLEMFEGPLDLLLYLIKKDQINIYDIPITQVTEQYLEYIELMKLLNLDIVGDFLVMAATLIHIKSKMLLPPDPSEEKEPEVDPRDELVQRLLEYQKFKEIAQDLEQKASVRQDFFPRTVDEEKISEFKEDAKEVFFEVSLFDLISAFTKAMRRLPAEKAYEIMQEEYTVEQKIHDILHIFIKRDRIVLSELLGEAKTKMEIIVIFLGVLELIRLKEIVAVQPHMFEEIEIVRNKENTMPEKV